MWLFQKTLKIWILKFTNIRYSKAYHSKHIITWCNFYKIYSSIQPLFCETINSDYSHQRRFKLLQLSCSNAQSTNRNYQLMHRVHPIQGSKCNVKVKWKTSVISMDKSSNRLMIEVFLFTLLFCEVTSRLTLLILQFWLLVM